MNARYEAILSLPQSTNEPEQLREMADTLETHLRALEALGENVNNNLMVLIVWLKLPTETRIRLDEKIEGADWNLEELRKEINHYINARYENTYSKSDNAKSLIKTQRMSTAEALISSDITMFWGNAVKMKCIFCKMENHWSDQCKKHSTIEQRKTIIKGHCFKCLQNEHGLKPCKVEKMCVYCRKKNEHHRSLCPTHFPQNNENAHVVTDANTRTEHMLLASNEKVLMQTAMIQIKGQSSEQPIQVRAILDSGSQRSYITENMAEILKVEMQSNQTLSVLTFGSSKPNEVKMSTVSIEILMKEGNSLPLKFDVVNKITGPMTRASFDGRELNE